MTIRNPGEWVADQVSATVHTLEDAGHELQHPGEGMEAVEPEVRSITVRDLKEVLTKGFSDFGEYRTDIFFIGVIYPLAGLVLARLTARYGMLPMLFPLASGFALPGPVRSEAHPSELQSLMRLSYA